MSERANPWSIKLWSRNPFTDPLRRQRRFVSRLPLMLRYRNQRELRKLDKLAAQGARKEP